MPQNEYLEDITSEYFATPNMIMCMVAAARADAMVNTPNQPYLASVEAAKCEAKGSTSSGGDGDGGGGGQGLYYMAINAQRADTGCDASGNGCTAPMIVQGHIVPKADTDADDYKLRVYLFMEV